MFLKKHVDFGRARVGEKKKLYFEYDALGDITDVKASCDCSDVANDKANNRIIVIFKPKRIPVHLAGQGKTSYKVNKSVSVHSVAPDGTVQIDELTFEGIVSK